MFYSDNAKRFDYIEKEIKEIKDIFSKLLENQTSHKEELKRLTSKVDTLERYSMRTLNENQIKIILEAKEDFKRFIPILLNLNFKEDVNSLIKEAVEKMEPINVVARKILPEDFLYDFYEGELVVTLFPQNKKNWQVWINWSGKKISLKLLGVNDLKGLNMFGSFSVDEKPEIFIMSDYSDGFLIYKFIKECAQSELSYLIFQP
jgi:hypothetical protein